MRKLSRQHGHEGKRKFFIEASVWLRVRFTQGLEVRADSPEASKDRLRAEKRGEIPLLTRLAAVHLDLRVDRIAIIGSNPSLVGD